MKKFTRFWPATALAVLILTGCAVHSPEPVPVPETEAHVTVPPETTAAPTEPIDIPMALTKEWDPEKICLRFQPTDVVVEGEDCRYYIPADQEAWLSAYEQARGALDPADHWEETDRSTGVWLCYGDDWWCLLSSGDILFPSQGKIPREDCQALNTLVESALEQLNMEPPVRPEDIRHLRKATLEWYGPHTLMDPEKLSRLETMLSHSEELWGGAQCWFTAPLTLEREDGTVLTLSMATDSCGTWLSQGVYYQYASGNEAFYNLFLPEDDDLVPLSIYLPQAFQSLRYADESNFTGQQVYNFTEAYLRYGTVKKLQAVEQDLASRGYRLLIWDAYRPLSAQQALWDICPDPNFVSHPVTGNRNHCRGNSLDLTLADETGNPVEMPSAFDDFTGKADRDYSDCTDEAAANAQLLQGTMEAYGFTGYQKEWWHFTDNTDYPVEENFDPQFPSSWQAECEEFITLRRKPSTTAEALCRIPAGDAVTLLANSGDFAYVSYQGQTGYVLRSYVAACSE